MARSGRLLELAYLLRGRRALTVRDIAERLEISIRTAYRDLQELEASKIPLEASSAGWRLADTAPLPPISVTSVESALLRLALANPALRRQKGLRRVLESISSKLAAATGKREGTNSVLEIIAADRSGIVPEAIFDALSQAASERRICDAVYDSLSGGERSRRRIDPYRIFLGAEAWYLAAYCHRNRAIRIFRLDRFDEVELLEERFEIETGFDLNGFLGSSWEIFRGNEAIEVIVIFAPSLRALVTRARHHPSETVTMLPDGSCEYRATVSNLTELARWIVTFGGLARAIQPPELAREVGRLGNGAADAHSQPGQKKCHELTQPKKRIVRRGAKRK